MVASVWPFEILSGRSKTRITDSPEFERIYRNGRAYRGKLFAVHVFPNDLETSRLGLSVSKKVGNAVVRNKVSRRLREVFHEALPGVQGGMDLVVSARPACSEARFDELRAEFSKALVKLGKAAES